MYGEKIISLDAIKVENRLLIPFAKLSVFQFDKNQINLKYTVVAIKIIENDMVYFKNIQLSKKEFKKLKKDNLKKI